MNAPNEVTGPGRNGTLELASFAGSVRRNGPALAGWLLPFILVLYLALKEGGYDTIIRSEVGIAIWWVVLVGVAVGVLPTARIGRAGWVGVGLLGVFALWTGFGIWWSESAERSVAEFGRVAMLLGVFVLALLVQREGAARRAVSAVGAATAAIAVIAVISRMIPDLLPADNIAEFLASTENRLSYPLGYWNGLGELIAIGLPLITWVATSARLTVVRALAAAAIPVMALVVYLTLSRGGAGAAIVAMAVLLLLHPRRLQLLPTLLLGVGGSVLLILAASQRDAFQDGLVDSAATSQGGEMLAMALIVCGGVGLIQAAIALGQRYDLGPRLEGPPRRTTGIIAGALAAVAIVAALVLGAPGELSDRWDEFKEPNTAGTDVDRFGSASGSNRYQYWESSVDANATDPLLGIGPGTFEYWWARDNPLDSSTALFVRDAHSLYLETLAELGIVGFVLIVGFVGFVLAVGTARAIKRRRGSTSILAAATAGGAAFATAAAVDWAWELTVLPVCFLLLAAVILGRDTGPEAQDPGHGEPTRPAIRFGLAGLAVVALVAVAVPFAGVSAVEDSQAKVQTNALGEALADAQTASGMQPYAATPYLQEALVLERAGSYDAAAIAAIRATEEEPTNWRPWFILARIEAARGSTGAAIDAFREARSLNPRSPLFAP